MVQADYLFLMTDVDCLYNKNPRTHTDASPIEVVEDIDALEADVSSAGSNLGTGGMSTKIVAARLATSAGVTAVIARSSNPENVLSIINYIHPEKSTSSSNLTAPTPPNGESGMTNSSPSQLDGLARIVPLHTRFLPDPQPIRDRSFWLLHGIAPHGVIFIDEGAHRALSAKAGLLPAGIVRVEGQFAQQEAVRIAVVPAESRRVPQGREVEVNGGGVAVDASPLPVEIGRALVNYSASEIIRICGRQSTDIYSILGYADSEYVAQRENISLAKREKSRPVTPSRADE